MSGYQILYQVNTTGYNNVSQALKEILLGTIANPKKNGFGIPCLM